MYLVPRGRESRPGISFRNHATGSEPKRGSSQTQRQAVGVGEFHCSTSQSQKQNYENEGAAWSLLMLRGKQRDDGADDQSGDQSANVSGVVDAGKGESKDEVVNDKSAQAAQCPGERAAGQGKLS